MVFRAFLIMMVFFFIIGFIHWWLSELGLPSIFTRKKQEPDHTHEDALRHIAMREHELDLMPHVDPEVESRCEECRAGRIRAAIVVDKFEEYYKKEQNEAKLMEDALQAFAQYGISTPNELRGVDGAPGVDAYRVSRNQDFS